MVEKIDGDYAWIGITVWWGWRATKEIERNHLKFNKELANHGNKIGLVRGKITIIFTSSLSACRFADLQRVGLEFRVQQEVRVW